MSGNRISGARFGVLDGWRGISILAVLACHLLPLGPKPWKLNESAGLFGMALFFTLSGFLITRFLLRGSTVRDFLIRRFCRILPVAWLGLLIGLPMAHAIPAQWMANCLFFANYPPFWLTPVTDHYWSLCVEMQFYVGVALVYGFSGRRGLLVAVPLGAVAITALRIANGVHFGIVTYMRADEILAGGVLAMIYEGALGQRAQEALRRVNPLWMLPVYVLSTNLELGGWVMYLRPYLAASMVGSTLLRRDSLLHPILTHRALRYVAEISYALYIFHPLLQHTWLGLGSKPVKYLKRPLLFVALWAVAHASTFYYEKRWTAWGVRLTSHGKAAVAVA